MKQKQYKSGLRDFHYIIYFFPPKIVCKSSENNMEKNMSKSFLTA